jgi:hypothetical protein
MLYYHIVTFKDLQKLVQSHSGSGPEQDELLRRLRNKPFWIWDLKKHKQEDLRTKGDCCFNHIIGNEPDHDEDNDQLEKSQEEETGEKATTNMTF